MSPGVLGQSVPAYQQNAQNTNYVYTGPPYARTQQSFGSYAVNSCNGHGKQEGSSAAYRSAVRGPIATSHRNNNASPHTDAPLSSTNVYIRGLDSTTTDEHLRQKCGQYGAILSTKAIMDKTTGQCKGYGFVDFENSESAQRAVEGLNQDGKYQAQMAKVSAAQQEQDPTNLYFANLPADFTEADLHKTLERFGMVISTRILKNADGTSRGVGFARMDNKELCDHIIRELNGKSITASSSQPLLVKFADSGKKAKSRSIPITSVYPSVPHVEMQQFYGNPQYEQLNGSYLRSSPGFPYLIQAPSQYVLNAQPQYPHIISGYAPDNTQLNSLSSQMHGLSLQASNATASGAAADVNGGAAGVSGIASNPSATAMSHMAVHPPYPYPFYQYQMQYGVQAVDPTLGTMTVVTSATPPSGYIPSAEMVVHADTAAPIYGNQPPPSLKNMPPSVTAATPT
ncbi:hypothetical protein AB6A40_004745 [Gnathostoma spinigerum]|uniref:Protein alan shepard n=1 Tax=Gnathostoma spinigerum TaxID=75299 RepID=A0ABD6EEF8_9BILA